ncbi:hypothetical protein BC941DRAFT_248961 [Chlamydoabsidia padenii]|nr:hypothetical protein BC941DRAFT_248961 [Chlamydoabsidia padenii]
MTIYEIWDGRLFGQLKDALLTDDVAGLYTFLHYINLDLTGRTALSKSLMLRRTKLDVIPSKEEIVIEAPLTPQQPKRQCNTQLPIEHHLSYDKWETSRNYSFIHQLVAHGYGTWSQLQSLQPTWSEKDLKAVARALIRHWLTLMNPNGNASLIKDINELLASDDKDDPVDGDRTKPYDGVTDEQIIGFRSFLSDMLVFNSKGNVCMIP